MKIEQQLEKVSKYYHLRENEYYHTIDHIRYMLRKFYEYEKEVDQYYPNLDKSVLIDAILYHDAGYEPGNIKNEDNAAIIYMNKVDHTITMQHKLKVIEAILSTVPFSSNSKENDCDKILHDLDWIAFSTDKFIHDEKLICNEYKRFSEKAFYKARIKFYEKCLDFYGENLYHSKVFEKYNLIAYKNIKSRIEFLKNQLKEEKK